MIRDRKGKPVKGATVKSARPKRPRDPNQFAQFMVKATTEQEDVAPPPKVSAEVAKYMAELGRRGGRVGGKVRAEKLTPERRREISLKAARSRWDRLEDSK